jgi:hypothetical protein
MLGVAHVLIGKPVPTFPGHALWFAHVLIGKPVPTFPGHALEAIISAAIRADNPALEDHLR